jgi:hypothetical protein
MSKPTVRIHNSETGKVIDREMTDAEFDQYNAQKELDAAQIQLKEQELAAKEKAKAKLEALGLSTDDLAALGF